MKESKGTLAAKKAWETMRAREAQMSPAELQEVRLKRSQAAHKAAKKAWKTMKSREAEMSPKELREVRLRRSQAAYKAWKTIRGEKA